MEPISTTPFGARLVTADLIRHHQAQAAEAEIPHHDKWELFRDLCTARLAFGLSDRDLAVLNALLSFHPERALSDNQPMIVFPSNAALSERAHGMAESTLRRHLAALVGAGVIARHDSPNGKRYAARDASGALTRAFGFNLRPMLVRAVEIVSAASEARAAAERLRRLREEVSLLCRDAGKLSAYGAGEQGGPTWQRLEERAGEARRMIRRRLSFAETEALRDNLRALIVDIHADLDLIYPPESHKTDGNDAENERHCHNSKPYLHDSEPCLDKQRAADVSTPHPKPEEVPLIPLALVIKACPEIRSYARGRLNSWYDLVAAADFVRGMMGVSPDAWLAARQAMGEETAAVVLACILERAGEINSPGGYLRALTGKALDHAFSPGPMVMALLNAGGQRAA